MKTARTLCATAVGLVMLVRVAGYADAQNVAASPVGPQLVGPLSGYNLLDDSNSFFTSREELDQRLRQQAIEIEQLRAQISNANGTMRAPDGFINGFGARVAYNF